MSKKYIITENDVVDNVTSSTTDRPLSAKQGKTLSDTLSGHTGNTENPHNVTSKQLGLGIVVKTFAELKEALMTAQDVPVVLGNDIVVTERIEVVSNILSMNGYAITSDGEGYGFLRIGGGGGKLLPYMVTV